MYSALINEKTFDITPGDGAPVVDGDVLNWHLSKISDDQFLILVDNQRYNAEVVKIDRQSKTFVFKINGRQYTVALKDRFDLLLEKMGMNNGAANKINAVKAPMPGLIIDLRVKEGDVVRSGDPLLVLEAMKMENVIKAAGDAIVKFVKIKKGDSVEKNQVLIEF